MDGNPNNQWHGGSCTHTDYATDAWWRVDLGSSFPVAEVVIVNRLCIKGSDCAGFMNSFEIRIGELMSNMYGNTSSCMVCIEQNNTVLQIANTVDSLFGPRKLIASDRQSFTRESIKYFDLLKNVSNGNL